MKKRPETEWTESCKGASATNYELRTTNCPAILANNLYFTYTSDGQQTCAIRGVSIELARGEFVALTGRSGCGKSTLLYLLGLMLPPDHGHIDVDGASTACFDDADRTKLRREKIGFVFQRFNLIPVVSARENIRLAMRIRHIDDDGGAEANAEKLLDAVGLADVADKLPGQMSVGQQQRVAIARALAGRPAVLLADEPTGNLDSQTAEEVLALLRRCNKEFGQTILMITHDDRVAAAADRVIHMTDGQIEGQKAAVSTSTPATVKVEEEDELTREAGLAAKRVNVRGWFHFYQIFLMFCLAGVIAFSLGTSGGPGGLAAVSVCLAYLIYMSLACTFLPLPTTMLILFLASPATGIGMNPWVIVGIGAIGTTIANLNDYHIVSALLRLRKMQKVRNSTWVRDATRLFAKAPFLTLTLFAFIPVPVDVVRLLAIGHGYSRLRYAVAYLVGRFPRYLLLVFWAEVWKPKWWEVLIVGGVFALLALWKMWRDHAVGKRSRPIPTAVPAEAVVETVEGVEQ